MKKTITIISLLVSSVFISTAQSDTIVVKEQKGFLFLSTYNYLYDYRGEEMRLLGFHDFFFPVSDFDSNWLTEPNIAISFKKGLRVDSIHNRLPLKNAAFLYKGKDSSDCYEYEQFYILPVIISYKVYSDNWPFVCSRNYFDIQVNDGASLHFEYQHQAIKPIGIKTLINKIPINIKNKKPIQKSKAQKLSHSPK
ncbi:hypothetical protein DBR32_10410 [Taibaiella sp. KBW10]|uniref:hypothetical protein n=1 Tax=Taibaiella sp. KBW10 TaxID=2153357 RepID=UPI000F5ABE0F|nr:hypothetical protein [Taibaiella sp. KBW10]RQO31108.1 hypothetical protein DBR32_10410 [Taibaiella sp. KBW10]